MEHNPKDFIVEVLDVGTQWYPKRVGVKVTHIPTGYWAKATKERSQHANHFQAFREITETLNRLPQQLELF